MPGLNLLPRCFLRDETEYPTSSSQRRPFLPPTDNDFLIARDTLLFNFPFGALRFFRSLSLILSGFSLLHFLYESELIFLTLSGLEILHFFTYAGHLSLCSR